MVSPDFKTVFDNCGNGNQPFKEVDNHSPDKSVNSQNARTVHISTESSKHLSYNLDDLIGEGYGRTVVFRGAFNNKACAIKRISIIDISLDKLENEVGLMKFLKTNKNIVKYMHHILTNEYAIIAMELCKTTLTNAVENRKIKEPFNILKQAANGLSHLHERKIVHMDLKPDNILLKYDYPGELVKIADFGVSKEVGENPLIIRKNENCFGTLEWSAPEVLELFDSRHKRSVCITSPFALDIFSLGCVFYYTLSQGQHPFGDMMCCSAQILDNAPEISPVSLQEYFDEEFYTLIKNMIHKNPCFRPNCDEVLKCLNMVKVSTWKDVKIKI